MKTLTTIDKKNKRAIARLISLVERNDSDTKQILTEVHSKTGNAYRIGITGPPGAGKSTITNQLTKLYLKENKSVGIIAVDPTSPFSGGALLGDRVRMNEVGINENVFIRSMATRGNLGGLSKRTIDAADIIDAAGFDIIILETVGVGQSELDIAKAADTTIVTLVPESGDSIQAMKAGLMEIADFFVLNKCDRPGSENAYTSIKTILMLKEHNENSWLHPIVKTVASMNRGIDDLLKEINNHKGYLFSHNILFSRRQENSKLRIKEIIKEHLLEDVWNINREEILENSLEEVLTGSKSPYTVAEEIISNYKNN